MLKGWIGFGARAFFVAAFAVGTGCGGHDSAPPPPGAPSGGAVQPGNPAVDNGPPVIPGHRPGDGPANPSNPNPAGPGPSQPEGPAFPHLASYVGNYSY